MKQNTPHIFSWMNPKLRIGTTDKYGVADLPTTKDGQKTYKKVGGEGYAVYATSDIAKNEVLFVMGGYILTIEDENNLTGIVADKPIELSEHFSIGPRKASDIPKMPQHYVNHSCNPNAGFQGQIFLNAMQKIKVGEEITYDYAMIMQSNPSSDSYFSFDCLCNTKKCRGKVAENDWKSKELQKRYEGYFQFFLQKKIDKLKRK